MDITFHYFAVKTLARKAGFDENEAQVIAEYSQYVDDFNWIKYIDCKNIPDYIKNDKDCDLYVSNLMTLNMNFNPATTGFYDWMDLAAQAFSRMQKFTTSPFHFVPPSSEKAKSDSAKEIRTVPAVVGDGSFISNKMIEVKNILLKGQESRNVSLMRLGMVLHTFADTYAHQLFSGYNSWVNNVKVVSVTDNISGEDMTARVNSEIEALAQQNASSRENAMDNSDILNIGHMWASTTPDLTNVSFEMKYKASKEDSEYSMTYARSNTETFVTASKHILNFLLSCRGLDAIKKTEWSNFSEKLADAFLYHLPKKDVEKKLATHWNEVFPEYTYHYDKNQIEKAFYLSDNRAEAIENSSFGKSYSDTFYRYNYIADKMLVDLYQEPHPRKAWFN